MGIVEVGLATALAQQPCVPDHNVMAQRLGHIVDRQRRNRSSSQRLHLHPRLPLPPGMPR